MTTDTLERTTDRLGHTGEACRECETPFAQCSESVYAGRGACCGRCYMTDTHEARRPEEEPEDITTVLARVLGGFPAGAPVPAADRKAAEALRRELAAAGIHLSRLPAATLPGSHT